MHVIVVGCGRTGAGLAAELTNAGHSVAIIDKLPRSFRRLPPDWPGQRIVGFGFDRDHLEEAGAKRAAALAAVTSGDNSNILCARIARETYEIPNVVARIYDSRRAEIFQRLGIPTVPTVPWTIDHVLRRILPERAVTEWSDATGHLHLIEQPLPTDWEGRPLPPAALHGDGIRVVAVTRAGAADGRRRWSRRTGGRRPPSRHHPRRGRQAQGVVPQCVECLGIQRRGEPRVKVAIAGAGNVGRFLTEDLARSGHEVVLIDRDPDRLASLPSIEGVRYVTADACEVSSLQAAHFDEMDVVVATTGDDEDNLVISQLAKQEFAVPRVIARVNHPKNHWLFNEMWGVDVAVSTPHLLAGLVEEAVSVGTLVRLLQFEGGHTRLMEVTLDAGSPVLGSEFGALVLPRGSAVVALVRDGHVVVPRSDAPLVIGDEVVLLVSAQCEDDEIRTLLLQGS